jgi:glycosyltransferase involved in cell wall biosynthesis
MEAEYLRDFRVRWPLKKHVRAELKRLRRWDLSTSRRVDRFIANSSETRDRIQRIYGRDSIVIPPPVEERFFSTPLTAYRLPLTAPSYLLAIGRMVPYKRFDLLIELANTMKAPLKIAGKGPDMERLKRLAGPTVEFLGFVPDADLPGLYAHASCLLFPQIEDAGIVPLEALASGIPVVALGKGGVLDVVKDGMNGLLVPDQSIEAFRSALERFSAIPWDRTAIRESARPFARGTFIERVTEEVVRVRQERIAR